MEELKHCPFCGSSEFDRSGIFFIRCNICKATGPKMNGGKNDAYDDHIDFKNAKEAWNNRYYPAEFRYVVDLARRCEEANFALHSISPGDEPFVWDSETIPLAEEWLEKHHAEPKSELAPGYYKIKVRGEWRIAEYKKLQDPFGMRFVFNDMALLEDNENIDQIGEKIDLP